jgi:hypothetical protein
MSAVLCVQQGLVDFIFAKTGTHANLLYVY